MKLEPPLDRKGATDIIRKGTETYFAGVAKGQGIASRMVKKVITHRMKTEGEEKVVKQTPKKIKSSASKEVEEKTEKFVPKKGETPEHLKPFLFKKKGAK